MFTFGRRSPISLVPVAAALIAACGGGTDPRTENLAVGMSKDSAVIVMGGERPSRTDSYLTGGKYIESMLFIRPGSEPEGVDTLTDRERTPVIVIDGTVAGWGWKYWDSVASGNRIQVPPK